MEPEREGLADLLAKVRVGDDFALARLLERHAESLERIARLRLGPALRAHLDPADVVQSVYRILLEGLRRHKFEITSEESLRALALKILRRRIARHWRRFRRQPGTAPDTAHDAILEAASHPAGNPAEDPVAAAIYHEELAHLLGGLTPLDRRLVQLRLQGYSTAAAAQELGLEPSHLRVRLVRLRKRLTDAGIAAELL